MKKRIIHETFDYSDRENCRLYSDGRRVNYENKCNVTIAIIDAGPAPYPRANGDIDLHPIPARVFYGCMNPDKKLSSSDNFTMKNVTVTG